MSLISFNVAKHYKNILFHVGLPILLSKKSIQKHLILSILIIQLYTIFSLMNLYNQDLVRPTVYLHRATMLYLNLPSVDFSVSGIH